MYNGQEPCDAGANYSTSPNNLNYYTAATATAKSLQLCLTLWERVGCGKEVQEGVDICIPVADSC